MRWLIVATVYKRDYDVASSSELSAYNYVVNVKIVEFKKKRILCYFLLCVIKFEIP